MAIAEKIAPHLPYLRRFARALCGSQDSGDAYVVAVLESLVEDPGSFPSTEEPRVALYASFLKVWNSVRINQSPSTPLAGKPESPVDRSLDAITPIARQVFLLTSVEGFTTAQVAQIMDISIERVTELVGQAGKEIAEQVATDVLIIEDEPLIAMDLESLVQGLGHSVSAIARTHRDAVAAAQAKRPGLVLADIQLADGSSGLDAVNEILLSFDMPVIFITAFPERLLTGERPEPTFLITKPFETNTVRAIISQALFFGTSARVPGSHVNGVSQRDAVA